MPYLPPRLSAAKDAAEWPTAAVVHPAGSLLAKRLSAITRWAGACIEVIAAYYTATAMYEQLSRLSDTELARRGLSRGNLARDVLATCDRTTRLD
jgi:hypothetical protein